MARKRPAKPRRRPRRSRALGSLPEKHERFALVRLEAAERALAKGDAELDADLDNGNCERSMKNLILAQKFAAESTVHRLSMESPLRRSDRVEGLYENIDETWRRWRWKCAVVPKRTFSRGR